MNSISEILFKASHLYKSNPALKISNRIISYDELNSKALSVSAFLLELGAMNETIGLVGQRKPSTYFGLLGIIYSGNNYTPLNPKYNPSRLKEIIKDARIRFFVGAAEDIEMLEKVLGYQFPNLNVVVPEEELSKGEKWISISSLDLKNKNLPILSNEKDLAYLLYTSGSTGIPKGVKVSHVNIIAFIQGMTSIYKLEPGFRASQVFDLSFDPSVSDIFFTWFNGGLLCVLPEEEMLMPSEFIKREKIEFWNSVPSLASFMNRMGQLTPNCFPNLKYSMFCGEQFPKKIADAWRLAAPNSSIENLYGPTETTIYISRYVYKKEDSFREFKNSIIPIGQPLPGQEVAIVDEKGCKVSYGEICFKGKQVTSGYLNDEIKTNQVFVNFDWDHENTGKWYKTGDIGFINETGDLECVGRRDSQIKIGGRRIEIGEIESVMSKFPQTSDAIVVAIKDENGAVTGVVAFVSKPVSKEEIAAIRRDSVSLIEKVFFPKNIYTIDEFPLNPSGKIDRKSLEKIASKMISSKSQ